MTDKIKSSFDSIQAEDSLKKLTLRRLHANLQAQSHNRRNLAVRRFAALVASIVLILSSAAFSYNLYFTKIAYVDLDINPSLELAINRFRRVISVEAYNTEASVLLAALDLRHKNVDVAIDELISAAALTGVLERERLVSVTVQALSGDGSQLLESIQTGVSASVSHHGGAMVDAFSVDVDTRAAAHDLHISPAKYLAILELQAVDPTATVDQCKNHSIGQIRQLTLSTDEDFQQVDDNSDKSDTDSTESDVTDSPTDTDDGNITDSGDVATPETSDVVTTPDSNNAVTGSSNSSSGHHGHGNQGNSGYGNSHKRGHG